MPTTTATPVVETPPPSAHFWPEGWWRLMELRIGIIPLPIFILLAALVTGFVVTGNLPNEINMWIAVLALFGFICAEVGKRIPILRNIGGAAICATFVPSFLAFHHLLPDVIIKGVTDFTKSTSFLYLFIAAIIVGSILSMDRRVLIKGFLKIFVPLAVGSIAACAVGTLVGTLLGLGAFHTFYYVVVPIMAGGVGEGAIPLSLGYAGILHQPQGDLFAQVLPPVMLGSLTAILLAGTLNYVGKKFPHLTGEGRLQPGEHDEMNPVQEEITGHMDVSHIAAAGITAISLYLVGMLGFKLFGFPAPVTMLFLAVLVKLTQAVSPQLQEGSFVVYKFFSRRSPIRCCLLSASR
jgi:malate:Na+ symporter